MPGIQIQKESTTVPILASLGGPEVSSSLGFDSFVPASSTSKQGILLTAETEKCTFAGTTDNDGFYCDYHIGFHDPSTSKITLPTIAPTPIVRLKRSIKMVEEAELARQNERLKNMAARADLGVTFGTKKQKMAIKAREQNSVDVNSIAAVKDVVMESMEQTTKDAPTQDELNDNMIASLPLPPYNADAMAPEDIYPMSGLLPTHIARMVPLKKIMEASTRDELKDELKKIRLTSWLLDRIYPIIRSQNSSDDKDEIKEKLRPLVFMSYLLKFRQLKDHQINRQDLLTKQLNGAPQPLIDYFISAFTEQFTNPSASATESSTQYRLTKYKKDLLLSTYLAMALHQSGFSFEYNQPIAKDLGVPLTQLQTHMKAMGCSMTTLSRAQKEAAGLPPNSIVRKAVLALPFKIPLPSRGPASR